MLGDRLSFMNPFESSVKGKPPYLLKIRSSQLFITSTVCIAVFTDIFLYGVIVPVIPFALRVRAGVAADNVQHWVSILLAVYGAAFFVAAPIAGVVADRTSSRRGPLLLGLLVLLGSTVMLCLGKSLQVLLAGRLVQGISAAIVWTVALALLSDTVGKENSGQALGYVAIAYSMGVLVAPLLGGIVYEQSGYYAVFGMTFGVIGVDVILRLLLVEKKVAQRYVENLTQEHSSPPSGEGARNALELQPVKAASKVDVETQQGRTAGEADAPTESKKKKKKKKKKLPTLLILFKSKRILAAFWGNFVAACTFCAFDATLPIFVNRVFGWNSLGAGLIFIALCLPSFGGPIIGAMTDRYGPRWIAAGGLLLSLPFWILLRLVEQDTIRQIVLLCVLLVFIGLAMALTLTSLMSEFSKVCDAKERQDPTMFGNRSAYAQSYGIFNMAWAAGSLVGPLWAAAVERSAGWKTMTWTLGLLNAVSAIPVLLYSGGFIRRRKVAADDSNVVS